MWEALGEVLPPEHALHGEYGQLSAHCDWWTTSPAWRQEVRALYAQWELQDPALMALWQRTRQWSMDEFAEIFQTLSAPVDVEFYESQVEDEGRAIVGRTGPAGHRRGPARQQASRCCRQA